MDTQNVAVLVKLLRQPGVGGIAAKSKWIVMSVKWRNESNKKDKMKIKAK